MIRNLMAVGVSVCGLIACGNGDNSTMEVDPIADGSSSSVLLDVPSITSTSVVVDPQTGEEVHVTDTLDPEIVARIKDINEAGDTIWQYDTVFVPRDTLVRWVGNSALRITEVVSINLDWLDEDGDDPAWVEIYNAGDSVADLNGYYLVESLDKTRKWAFGNEIIRPKSFRNVFISKKNIPKASEAKDVDNRHYRTHTNWRLDKNGGTIYLIDKFYGVRDTVQFPVLEPGMSWGRVDGGGWRYMEKPTPEAPNTEAEAYQGVVPKFNFGSAGAGFYNSPVTLKKPNVSDGTKIRCTKDGSLPNENSEEFKSDMTIDHSMVLRCAAYKDGFLTKDVVTNTYFINEQVKMPVVAVTVDSVFFRENYVKCDASDPDECPKGMYADVERPVHVEYFEKGSDSKEKAWEIDAGISLMGNWSRVKDKKSVAIVMREKYQNGRINYPLFPTNPNVTKYKAFNLRNNGNRFVSDYIEDAMGGEILNGSGVDYQHSRQVVVFYNGHYYGIHDMRERFNESYIESNYGIDSKSVDMVKHLNDSLHANGGSTDGYEQMLKFIGSNDFSGENNANYEEAKKLIDVGNFADYMAAEIYIHNGDWPNNNVRAWRSPEQPWKFMVYDLDHGFGWQWGVNDGEFTDGTNMFSWIKKGGGNKPCKETGCFANLYIQLIKNPDFKRLFINRSCAMWKGYLNGDRVSKVVNDMAATIPEAEKDRDLEKFKQNEMYYPGGFDWKGDRLKEWARSRDGEVVSLYKGEFFEDDENAKLVTVKIKADGDGTVLMEGMNLPGTTAPTNFEGKFFNGMQMELTAVATNGAVFKSWSGCEAVEGKPETCIATVTDGLSITANFK
jgi:hypothetical protein